MNGKVYLIGAGPGDPGLITVKGLHLLSQADTVIYDRLADQRLLSSVKPGAELVYVGKSANRHTLKQGEINALLVSKALKGKTVARLKGGDPFVFGRGGEEAEALVERGIPFEVVPGVTSAVAVPAYAGIPVTHRDFTSSVCIVTGHEDPTKAELNIDWEKISGGSGTLVFLMGTGNLPKIALELVKHGRSPQTPAAVIRWGTKPDQQTAVGTLSDIALKAENIRPPAVLVVGEVVNLREKLRWFDNRPLFGKRVLVTRSRDQASQLSEMLAEAGAVPIELPTIEIKPPVDYAALDESIGALTSFDWVVFTSGNGVDSFFSRLASLGRDSRAFSSSNICAIGPATAKALADQGLCADYIPEKYVSKEVLAGLTGLGVSGKRVLLARADIAGKELSQGLAAAGAEVRDVVAYRTVMPEEAASKAKQLLEEHHVDIVTFASSSTVTNLARMLEGNVALLKDVMVACIGPVTAATAQEIGLHVDVVAREHTIPGLLRALESSEVKV